MNIVFLQLFVGVLFVTLGLSLYLARSITTPISLLAEAADKLRQKCRYVKPVAAFTTS